MYILSTSIDVDSVGIQFHDLDISQRHHRECFVDFKHGNVFFRQIARGEDFRHGNHRRCGELYRS